MNRGRGGRRGPTGRRGPGEGRGGRGFRGSSAPRRGKSATDKPNSDSKSNLVIPADHPNPETTPSEPQQSITTTAPPERKPSPELKVHNIPAAVEKRSTTPNSHIDWAGEEDDSLPDLNDWGVSTGTKTVTRSDIISPIMVDGLKSLPEVVASVSSPPQACAEPADLTMPTTISQAVGKPQGTRSQARRPPSSSRTKLSFSRSNRGKQKAPPRPRSPTPSDFPARTQASVFLQENPRPVHHIVKSPPQAEHTTDNNAQSAERDTSSKLERPPADRSVPTVSVGTAQSETSVQRMPPSVDSCTESNKECRDLDSLPGLEASIHAPKDTAASAGLLNPHSPEAKVGAVDTAVSTPPVFARPAWPHRGAFHRRTHTVGRHPVQQSSSTTHQLNQSPRRSDAQQVDLVPSYEGYRSRSQSTSSTRATNRPALSQRPVITGEAILRLARTINNSSVKS